MFAAQMNQTVRGYAAALRLVELVSFESKCGKPRRTFGREALADPKQINTSMFLPFGDDYVNYLGPLGTESSTRFAVVFDFSHDNFWISQERRNQ